MSSENPNDITMPDADVKIIPIFLLIDISNSMNKHVGNVPRISIVNQCMREMFAELAQMSNFKNEIDVSIITFGNGAECVLNLCDVEQAKWSDLKASEWTNLSAALRLVKQIVEDRTKLPVYAGRPSIVLVSDGVPCPPPEAKQIDKDWQSAMTEFLTTGRTKDCDRFALGISVEDKAQEALKRFISGQDEDHLALAEDASGIVKFFRYISTHTLKKTRVGGGNAQPHQSNQMTSVRAQPMVPRQRTVTRTVQRAPQSTSTKQPQQPQDQSVQPITPPPSTTSSAAETPKPKKKNPFMH